MRYIFDFDDVIFYTTKFRKEYTYTFFEKLSINHEILEEYYQKARGENFSMKKLIKYFSLKEEIYDEVMQDCINFANKELIEIIKKLGKENCFIITYGEEEFQLDKIRRVGVENLFSEVFVVVSDEKKELIEKICNQFRNETILFVDDKIKHFKELDLIKFPNLKPILFNEQGLEKLKEEIVRII